MQQDFRLPDIAAEQLAALLRTIAVRLAQKIAIAVAVGWMTMNRENARADIIRPYKGGKQNVRQKQY